MTNEQIKFVGELFGKLNAIKSVSDKFSWNFEYNTGKNYWTINFEFRSANSEYKDCVVFYPDDAFDQEEILKDVEEIVAKATAISK